MSSECEQIKKVFLHPAGGVGLKKAKYNRSGKLDIKSKVDKTEAIDAVTSHMSFNDCCSSLRVLGKPSATKSDVFYTLCKRPLTPPPPPSVLHDHVTDFSDKLLKSAQTSAAT